MISKIQMQGIASYIQPTTFITDKKVNIIYGLNGTGKSTLSNYLYDINSTDFEKCTITIDPDEIILTYNQKFIHENFFIADGLKGIFSLSKENKDIEEKIKNHEEELNTISYIKKEKEEEIKRHETQLNKSLDLAQEKIWEIKKNYTGGDRTLEYCLDGLKAKKETLFNYLIKQSKPEEKPTKTIERIKQEVESISGSTAQKHIPLAYFPVEESGIESDPLLSTIIIGNEDSPISELIAKLGNSDWVKEGLTYLEGNTTHPANCPFCQQKTITTALEKQIKDYFDEKYNTAISNLDSLIEKYATFIKSVPELDKYKESTFSGELLPELTERHSELKITLEKNISLLRQKKSTPSLAVTLKETASTTDALNETITTINASISDHNARIDNRENELTKLKKEFWNNLRWEYDQTTSAYQAEEASTQETIRGITAERNTQLNNEKIKREEISALQKQTVNIDKAIENINKSLANLGITEFSITKHSDSLYRIVRAGNSEAKFSSLSEGEKMLISFLYFHELCHGKKTPSDTSQKKVIVIDDPVSSLSHIYVYNIGQLIKNAFFNSSKFEQVILLTHSLYFFYEMADSNHSRRKETQNLFRLSKNSLGSNLKPMKYEEIQNDYHSYWMIVNDKDQPPALVANCMRNIIEYFFNFVQKADLSNVMQKPELQDNRFQAFCRYINRESYSLGQNIFDFKEFNYDDFRAGLKLVFQETGYPEHYEKMTSSLVA